MIARRLFAVGALMLGAALAVPSLAEELGRAQGEVRRVDKDASKVTLRHGPIAGLDMPAMSMVFQVRDKALLDRLKEGDRIRFVTSRENGAFILKSFEPDK